MSAVHSCSRFAGVFAAMMLSAAFPGFGQARVAPSDWESLVDRPRALSFEASASRAADGERWIMLDFEYEVVLKAPFEAAVDAYWFGIEKAADVFSRVDSVRVFSREPTLVLAEQVTGVRILGLAFLSKATFRNDFLRPGPDAASIGFRLVESDGSLRDNYGEWLFLAIRGSAEPRVYIRYRVHTEVEARFPGQLGIMKRFGPGDVEALLRQFSRELYRRPKK